MSFYDLVDNHDTPLNRTASYADVHREGQWHRGAHVMLTTADERVVIQQRAADLPTFPGVYEMSAGGGVDAGETPAQAALREISEELGLVLNETDLRYVGTYVSEDVTPGFINRTFLYCYTAIINEQNFAIDPLETQAVRFVPVAAIEQAMTDRNNLGFGTLAYRNDLWRMLLDVLPSI